MKDKKCKEKDCKYWFFSLQNKCLASFQPNRNYIVCHKDDLGPFKDLISNDIQPWYDWYAIYKFEGKIEMEGYHSIEEFKRCCYIGYKPELATICNTFHVSSQYYKYLTKETFLRLIG